MYQQYCSITFFQAVYNIFRETTKLQILTISCLLTTSRVREKASFDHDIVSDDYIVYFTTKAISK